LTYILWWYFSSSSGLSCQDNFRRLRYSSLFYHLARRSPLITDYSLYHFRYLAEWRSIDNANTRAPYRPCGICASLLQFLCWSADGWGSSAALHVTRNLFLSSSSSFRSQHFRTAGVLDYDEAGFMLQPRHKSIWEAWLDSKMFSTTRLFPRAMNPTEI